MRTETAQLSRMEVAGADFIVWEKGSGQPLVLLHGMFGDHLDWEPVLEPLAQSFRVIAVDLPGFGETSKTPRNYSAELFVRSLDELFTKLLVECIVLVGNSFGGELSIQYTLAHPERIRALVLDSSGGLRKYSGKERCAVAERFKVEHLLALTPGFHEVMFAPVFADRECQAWRRYLERQNARLSRDDYPAYAHAMFDCAMLAFEWFFSDELRAIHCPTLLVWGDKDAVFPLWQANEAMKYLPNAQLAVISDAGHVPQLEKPAEFVQALETFVKAL